MGRNNTDRLQDESVIAGPLWCVPITSEIGAVWGHLPPDRELASVEGPAGVLTPIERQRIFSPHFATIFYTIPIRGLQDGQQVRIAVRSQGGDETKQVADFRLAHWQIEGVPQVVSFIISRILPKLEGVAAHSTLERFLSFISSWRATCRLNAEIAGRTVYTVDVATKYFAGERTSYFLGEAGFRREVIQCVDNGGKAVLLAPSSVSERAFTDVNGELVQLDFSNNPVTEAEVISWMQSLPPTVQHSLLDQLSIASSGNSEGARLLTALSQKKVVLPLAEPDAQLAFQNVFHAGGRLFVFAETSGAAPLESLRIEPFGGKGDLNAMLEVLSCACTDQEGRSVVRHVAWCDLPGPVAPVVCRLHADIGGQHVQHWTQAQTVPTGDMVEYARQFWPNAENDHSYLAEVASSLARAWVQEPLRLPIQSMALDRRCGAGEIDLQIIAGKDLSHLHSTLLGVRSSTDLGQPVRITLPSSAPAEAYGSISEWVRRYAFHARVDLLPARTPGSAAFDPGSGEAGRSLVAIQAGLIPPKAGWLGDVADHLRRFPANVLIGFAPGTRLRGAPADDIGTDDLLQYLKDEAIVAVAAPAHLLQTISIETQVCHSLVGGWVEWLAEILRQGGRVLNHPGLDMWNARPSVECGTFEVRVDEVSLSRKLSVTEYHELQFACNSVIDRQVKK